MTHQKRLSAPDAWPIERKTETFTVASHPGPHGEAGVPLVIILRDVLGYVDNAREAKFAVRSGYIHINGRRATDHQQPLGLFDILAFSERDEFYRIFPDHGGRLGLTPITADAAESKLSKVVGKHQVQGGQTQLALHNGGTVNVDNPAEYHPSDSVILELETNDVIHHLPYEEEAMVVAVAGQHAGKIGTIASIDVLPGSSPNTITVEGEDDTFETIEEYVVVIDEHFTGGADDG